MKRWLNAALIFLFLLFVVWVGYAKFVGALSRAKDVVLLQNLWTMRRAIDSYWQDCEKPPQSLQELINTRYLLEIPVDPLTNSNQTWIIEREKESSVPNTIPGIIDVRSAAAGADMEGKPYNEY